MRRLIPIFSLIVWQAVFGVAVQAQPAGDAAEAVQPPAAREDAGSKLVQRLHEAYRQQDYAAAASVLEEMLSLQPFNGDVMYRLAGAYAQSGRTSEAFELLVRIQNQGLAYDPSGDEAFESLQEYPLFDHLAEHLAKNAEPYNEAPVAFTTSLPVTWPEGIAHHPGTGVFYIGEMHHGRILEVTSAGESKAFFDAGDDGPPGFTALAVDADRGFLWAAGTAVRAGEEDLEINMHAAKLHRFGLENGELEASFEIAGDRPLGHLLNEIAVAPDGSVYVSDSLSPLIYRLEPGAEALEPFIGSARMNSLQGLTVDEEGRYLFVADWHLGIFRIDTASREVKALAPRPSVNLGGIHGLSFHDGDLIAVQTGTRPERVVRYFLSDDMTRVHDQQPLSANQSEYDRPGLGVLAGDGFYFIANSAWQLGAPPGDAKPAPVVVLKADPSLGAEVRKRARQSPADTPPPGIRRAPDETEPEADGVPGS